MSLDLLIFDFDGVLSNSEGLSADSLIQTFGELGLHLSHADVDRRFTGMGTQQMIADVREKDGIEIPDDFQDRNWAIVKDLMTSSLETVPHAIDMLEALPADLPKCITSNSFKEWIDHALAVTGMDRFFDPSVRFNADMVAIGKPAPLLHQHALAQMGGVDPSRTLILEDTLTGLGGGLAAGIEVWGVTAVSPNPDAARNALMNAGAKVVLNDLRDLPGLIAQHWA